MSSALGPLTIDADVLMNLLATDHVSAILSTAGFQGLVCPTTEAEVLYLNAREPGAPREPIDLERLFLDGTLVRCALGPPEIATYVRLAEQVDDGEAQVLAVAHHRSTTVATDDRKARRVAASMGLVLLSTPGIVLPWASSLADPIVAAAAIADIEMRARYRPRNDDPMRPAWDRMRGGV